MTPRIKFLLFNGRSAHLSKVVTCAPTRFFSWAEDQDWNPKTLRYSGALQWILVATWLSFSKKRITNKEQILKFLCVGERWAYNQDVGILAYYIWLKYFPGVDIGVDK